MKKVLILGGTGMLGHLLFMKLKSSNRYHVTATSRQTIAHEEYIYFDALNMLSFNNVTDEFDVIVNCIGLLVADCNESPHNAKLINTDLPLRLEAQFKNTSTKIIHISTDCVYSGSDGPYHISDTPNAQTVYGISKTRGEIVNNKDLTIRTSIIGPELSPNGTGLLNWFLLQHDEVNGYVNALWSGVTTLELAKMIEWTIDVNLTGLYQLASHSITKYDLLGLFKQSFNKQISIKPYDNEPKINKVLIDEQNYYNTPSIQDQMLELKNWMHDHDQLYSHYVIK